MKASRRNSKQNKQNNKQNVAESVLRLAFAAYSLWQLRKKSGHAGRPLGSSFAPAVPGERQYVRIPPVEEAADAKPARAPQSDAKAAEESKESRDLKHESYPKALLHVAIAAAKAWSDRRAASKGAALALYTLFSLAPMLVLVVTIAGFFFGQDAVRQALVDQMSSLMGAQGADAIKTMLAGGHHEGGGAMAGLVSAVLVLISATTAFAELKDSLDELWQVPPSQKSGLWNVIRERFLSFGLILVLALMLLASLAVSAALAALGNVWGAVADSPFRVISLVVSNVVSFGIVTALFAVIFKYMPAVKIAWKDVAIGAVLTAALFTIGKSLINLYVAKSDVSSSYGAAGSVVIMITWIYYSAQIFFYGALFTHEYALKLGSRSHGTGGQPARPHAPPAQVRGGVVEAGGAHGAHS